MDSEKVLPFAKPEPKRKEPPPVWHHTLGRIPPPANDLENPDAG